MCRAFPSTLGDKAKRWFRRLHQKPIKNWNDLAKDFISQFIGSKARTTLKERFASIKQGHNESLKKYLCKFNKQSTEVEKIWDDVAPMAVLSRLRQKPRFWWSIHEDGPWTYHDFLSWVENHIGAKNGTSYQEEKKANLNYSAYPEDKKVKKKSKLNKEKRKGWHRSIYLYLERFH